MALNCFSFSKLKKFASCRTSLNLIAKYSGLQYEAPEDSVDRTTIELTSKKPDMHPLMLTGYGVGKFRFANITVNGSVAILDQGVFKWKVTDPSEITAASMALFYLIYPKLDFVVIGTGNSYHPIKPEILAEIRKHGIGVEVQDTPHACGTYNLLKLDKPKQIGAALIPVTNNKLVISRSPNRSGPIIKT